MMVHKLFLKSFQDWELMTKDIHLLPLRNIGFKRCYFFLFYTGTCHSGLCMAQIKTTLLNALRSLLSIKMHFFDVDQIYTTWIMTQNFLLRLHNLRWASLQAFLIILLEKPTCVVFARREIMVMAYFFFFVFLGRWDRHVVINILDPTHTFVNMTILILKLILLKHTNFINRIGRLWVLFLYFIFHLFDL